MPARLRRFAKRAVAYLPALVASSFVGFLAMRGILHAAGRPAAPLDDSFIHFQYARRLAEGHFFSYSGNAAYSSGATSFLYPFLLAPFYAIGFRGFSILYIAWAIGTLAHAAVAVEAYRLADRLAGRGAALGAAAMCTVFGAFTWFAWSGMETVPLAWILLRTARVASRYVERSPSPPPSWIELAVLGIVGPLLRPEGILCSLIAAIAIARCSTSWRDRARSLIPLIGPLVVPLTHLAFTGHMASSTAMVKWAVYDPYYSAATVRAVFFSNIRLLLTNLLDGGDWTGIFIPEGTTYAIALGAVALAVSALRRRAPWPALFVGIVALGTLIPCTYSSFLWNRVRYIWPFAGAWFVMIACLAREIGDVARIRFPRLVALTPVLTGACVALLASKLPWTLRDLAQSARAIDHQQVALGEWAAAELPPNATIGVNDTGAIAYFGNHATFDVVGLTTEGEARYWAYGAASRFERYEKMNRALLPTHFIVYPHWMAVPAVLGKELHEATVHDQSILGGPTMIAYEARYDLLGSGALPMHPPPGELIDDIDIADVESEKAHGFDLTGTHDGEEIAMMGEGLEAWRDPTAHAIADGGRKERAVDAFWVKLDAKKKNRLVARVAAEDDAKIEVHAGDATVGDLDVPAGDWVERTIDLPDGSGERAGVAILAKGGRFTSFHYWVYASDR